MAGHGDELLLDAFDIKGTLSKKQRLIGLKSCIFPTFIRGYTYAYWMDQRERAKLVD